MGYSKVVKVSERSVKFVHQLDMDGKAYVEDVTIEVQPGVEASRLSYFMTMAGQIGVVSVSFSPNTATVNNSKFPE